jgi:hypothetical protein
MKRKFKQWLFNNSTITKWTTTPHLISLNTKMTMTYANENLCLLYLIPTKYIQLSPLFIIDYTSTSSPLIMSSPSALKKWPYKRGDLSWGGQLSYQVFYYFCASQFLPDKRVLTRGVTCPEEDSLVVFYYFCASQFLSDKRVLTRGVTCHEEDSLVIRYFTISVPLNSCLIRGYLQEGWPVMRRTV